MVWLLVELKILWASFYFKARFYRIALYTGILLGIAIFNYGLTPTTKFFWAIYLLVFMPLVISPVRKRLISKTLFTFMKQSTPKMSDTEREALDAGNTWWEKEIFSGDPDWKVIEELPVNKLSAREQSFMEGQVETLCSMLDDWDITHKRKDLSPEVWSYIKQNRFFGLIIPECYGGLEFSESAHSEIIMKIASRSTTAGVSVMVPNSLGPAKLLLSYGTEEQKNYYLPRLATGEEIPAFALTGPTAGSDASAIPDSGVVCYNEEKVLGIRLNWNKRYITLGPIATVLGMAFKLYDPDHLLGEKESIGITLALIPTNTKGVVIGRRHNPLDSGFQNGPNWGKDVFIPLDWIIGGVEQVGNGWKMLMQSLTTGRAISLPALGVAASKFTCRNTGAYARIRKQFNLPIGEFEGVEELLARMAGETYLIDAARKVTNAALDNGERPAVVSAILKYEFTERMRKVLNDGMDIQGGSGICLGPKNYLGRLYQVIPVSITVEGANVLTRTMMIFGQGVIRCHPFLQKELLALESNDLEQFDKLLCQHATFFSGNLAKSLWFGLSFANLQKSPGNKQTKRYYQQITRLSADFALLTDFALFVHGGTLKRRERLSGAFADVLSNLYLCSCVLKNYHHQGCPEDETALLHWACQHSIYQAQLGLFAICSKLAGKPLAMVFRFLVFPLGKAYAEPSDALISQTAKILLNDSDARDRLTRGIYINTRPDDITGRIEHAFRAVLAVAPIEARLHKAQKQGKLPKGDLCSLLGEAVGKGIITHDEVLLLETAEQARLLAITVDDFNNDEMMGR
jgi:acyl-CoA dehydrogenase